MPVPKSEQKKEPKGVIEHMVLKVAEQLVGSLRDTLAVDDLIEAVVSQQVLDPKAKRYRYREMTMRALDIFRPLTAGSPLMAY